MRKFYELTEQEQQTIQNRFVLPNEPTHVLVDENNVAFYRIAGSIVGCTVRNDNFHIHANKGRLRE